MREKETRKGQARTQLLGAGSPSSDQGCNDKLLYMVPADPVP